MNWRDFVEELKDVGESLAVRLRGERPLTPFFFVNDGGEQTEAYPLGLDHFKTDESMAYLVSFVTPLVTESAGQRCGWLLNADVRYLRGDGRIEVPECIVLAVFDREVQEVWAAPVHRYGSATAIGLWADWPANHTRSRLIRPIQEVLR